jgi:hypothetical protein
MTLMRIRLELARTPEFPHGSAEHGYEFIAPVSDDGHIDASAWRAHRDACQVLRFWNGEARSRGLLRHVGKGWRFDYDRSKSEDDEPFFKLDRHPLSPGNYVSLTEEDGVQRPFKVVSVTPVVERV